MNKATIELSRVMSIVICAMFYLYTFSILYPDLAIRYHNLWVQSPSKSTTKSFPLYQALRIVRKHKWHPVKTYPLMTRWQALKYAVWGKRPER